MLAEIIDKDRGWLLALAYKFTRNHHEAEDLVSEITIKALRFEHRFDGKSPRAWLKTMMRNTFINHYRRNTFRARRENRPPLQSVVQPPVESKYTELHKALNDVREPFGTVLKLHYFNELTYREISLMTGRPLGTVLSRMHRGKHLLKEHLLKEHLSCTTLTL